MIEITSGNMFESGAQALVNPVNCIGVMGAGLAYAFASKWPLMDLEYSRICRKGELHPGILHVWKVPKLDFPPDEPEYIINFPTKDDLSDSKMEYVEDGLVALRKVIEELDLASIAVPALGCGYGNLPWSDIRPLIQSSLDSLDCHILLYEPK